MFEDYAGIHLLRHVGRAPVRLLNGAMSLCRRYYRWHNDDAKMSPRIHTRCQCLVNVTPLAFIVAMSSPLRHYYTSQTATVYLLVIITVVAPNVITVAGNVTRKLSSRALI